MNSKKTFLLVAIILGAALLIFSASMQPQLTQDEQSIIVDSVIQTINPEGMANSIAMTVEARVLNKIGLEADTPVPADGLIPTLAPAEPSATPAVVGAPSQDASATPESYVGLHARFVNSYAYTVGEDEEGQVKIESEYTPNTLFNVDVVFENDGTFVWPPQVEMRNTGSVSTYTGHRPNVIIDTTSNPVNPGDKRGFTIAAHGSEELGYHTFYFQLFDAVSGNPIPGGYGSFSYLAK